MNYAIPVIAGLMYRDSVEVDELKHPIRVNALALVQDSAGAGRRRGAPAQQIELTPTGNRRHRRDLLRRPARAAARRGRRAGRHGRRRPGCVGANGDEARLPNVVQVTLQQGPGAARARQCRRRLWRARWTREPARVLHDVLEGWESREKARDVYGVVFTGEIDDETLAVDEAATLALRKQKEAPMLRDVPVIDIAPFRSATPRAKRRVAAEVGRAVNGIGFLVITGHGVDPRADRRRGARRLERLLRPAR